MILKSRVKIGIMERPRRSHTSSDWANWPEMENEGDGTDGDPARSSGQGRGENSANGVGELAHWRVSGERASEQRGN